MIFTRFSGADGHGSGPDSELAPWAPESDVSQGA
jgi:hypothetical protein